MRSFAAAGVGLLLATPVLAQQMTAQDFVTEAASGGMYEIQSSQFMLDQGNAPAEVAEFAQRMVQDHTQANEQLTELAGQHDLQIPAELLPPHRQMLDELQSAENPVETYGRQQVTAHQQSIELFGKYAEGAENADLRGFAEQTLPVLLEHFEMTPSLPGAQ